MRISQYFRPGQKIFLMAADAETPAGRLETLTVYLHDQGPGHLLLSLPYGSRGEESYPFRPDMPLQLRSDAYGVGVQVGATFRKQVAPDLIRVDVTEELQVFQRRTCSRGDLTLGVRYTKGKGALRTYRAQWGKNVQLLQQAADVSSLPPFPKLPVNLSATGIRLALTTPVNIADLCLLLLQPEPGEKPICALAEVVWLAEQEEQERRTAGMRFLNILESDQQRIEKLVQAATRKSPDIPRDPGQGPSPAG